MEDLALIIKVMVEVVVVGAKEVKEDGTLALGAAGINLRQHDIHETPGTTHQHHRTCLWTASVLEAFFGRQT